MRALALLTGVLAALLAAAPGCGPSSPEGCVDTILPGDLVVTEVFADYKAPTGSSGADTGKEWFEIYNASDHPIQLTGVTITHSRPDDSKAKSHTMGEVTIAPGQYFVLGGAAPDLVPGYVNYGYGADLGEFYNTDGGKLALACGTAQIDAAIYNGVMSGRSRELSAATPPDYTGNDDQVNWCDAKDSDFDGGNFGTPGADNDCIAVVAGMCNDTGTMRPTQPPAPGDLVITEVLPSPSKAPSATGEWFEVKALRDVDLNGLSLDRAGDSSAAETLASPECLHLAAGQYAVFAKSADAAMNGGLPAVAGTFKFTLVTGSATSPGDVQLLSGATVIDAVKWTRSSTGKSLQLDPDFFDATSNDDPSYFCDGATPYGAGDLGTPGADNAQCTILPPAGMCMDGATIRPIAKPAAGQLVITEYMPQPAGSDTTQEWFEITNTGAAAFDLNDLGLDRAGDSSSPNVIKSVDCRPVAPGGFAVFARSADPALNGGLPAVAGTFSFSQVSGTAASPGDLQVLDGTTVLDKVTWTTSKLGVSSQLDPGATTTTGNDDPAKFCAGTAPYGDLTNKGTPGAANAACP